MRKALVLALVCAAALAACNKDGEEGASGPAPGAQPLLAGPDEGAKPGEPGYVEGFSKGAEAPSTDAGTTTVAPGATGAAPGGARAGGGAAPRPVPAAADGSKPVRKAGLWQISTSSSGGPPPGAFQGRPGGGAPGAGPPGGGAGRPGGGGAGRGPGGGMNGTLCVTAESEAVRGPINAPRGGGDCVPKLSKSGATWTLTAVCTNEMQGNVITRSTTETLTGDLTSKYTLKTVSKATGMPAEMAAMGAARTTTQTGTYKGACPAGQTGGDFTGADGQKRNILQGGRG